MKFPSDDLGGDPPCWSHLTSWPEDDLCDQDDFERLLPTSQGETDPPGLPS
jgi:hypothetical protein